MREAFLGFVAGMKRPKMERRIPALLIGVALMGFGVAMFERIGFGTDPCSTMTLGLSRNLGISFGTLQLLFNGLLMLYVIRYDVGRIGLGTLANMVLVGYIADFFMYLFDQIPAMQTLTLAARIMIFVPTLALFLAAASMYMCVDMGVAPYDAVPQIISKRRGWSFRTVRMVWDFAVMVIGGLLGATVGPVTIGIALFIGPLVAWMSNYVRRFLIEITPSDSWSRAALCMICFRIRLLGKADDIIRRTCKDHAELFKCQHGNVPILFEGVQRFIVDSLLKQAILRYTFSIHGFP